MHSHNCWRSSDCLRYMISSATTLWTMPECLLSLQESMPLTEKWWDQLKTITSTNLTDLNPVSVDPYRRQIMGLNQWQIVAGLEDALRMSVTRTDEKGHQKLKKMTENIFVVDTTPIYPPFFQDNLDKLVPERQNHSGFQWSKRWWGGSDISWTKIICTSLQTDNHVSTSSLNFYALPAAQPSVSQHWRQFFIVNNGCKRKYMYICSKILIDWTLMTKTFWNVLPGK